MPRRRPSDDGIIPIHGYPDRSLPKRGKRRNEDKEGCLWSVVLIAGGVVALGSQVWEWLS